MNKFFLVLLVCCSTNFAIAQKKSNPTPDDIKIAKEYQEIFEDEKIIILDKSYYVTFEKNSRQGTVKVIVEEETEYLNISPSARLQHGAFYDAESEITEFTVKNRNGKNIYTTVQDEYLSSADLFHTDYRVKFVNLNLPLLGYKSRVKTKLIYNDIKYFTSTYFADSYRIINGKMSIDIPSWLSYDIKEFNLDASSITKKETPSDQGSIVTYLFRDIEPRSEEVNVPGPSFIYPHIIFVAKSFTDGTTVKNLFNSVGDLYGWYSSLVNKVEVDDSPFKPLVEELISEASSDEEKMSAIYYWVQDNIRYVAFEDGIAGFKPDSPQNVFEKRYGDCKGMAFLTKSMLEVAGFDARLVWIGTDRLAYNYTTPSLSVDNHMICAVKSGTDYIFLDATEKFGKLGDRASRIQTKEAMIENGDTFQIVKVPSNNTIENYDHIQYDLEIKDETLFGSVKRAFEGESRVSFQNSYYSLGSGDKDKILEKFLASGNSNYRVESISAFNAASRDKTILLNYDISIQKAVSSFDGTLYIDLDPLKRAQDYMVGERKVDLKLPMLEKEIASISLKLPDGYRIDTIPESYTVNNSLVNISYAYQKKDGTIFLEKTIIPKSRTIKVKDFELWDESFEGLKKASSEQLTLTRI